MKRKFILLPLLALILVGCGNNSSSSSSDPSSSSDSGSTDTGSSSETGSSVDSESSESSESSASSSAPSSEEGPKMIDDEKHDNFYKVARGENFDNRTLDETSGLTALNSLGDQKLLVVPVVFKDRPELANEQNHQVLEKVFFGESAETGWESVASFYGKSSFGRLTLSGEVMDYYYADYTTTEFKELEVSETQAFGEPDNYWDETHHLIRDIYEEYDADLLKEYDLDEDGHVDALWMVYMNPYQTGENNPFWAYKFYWNQEANKAKPTPNTYAWASFSFASEGEGYSLNDNKYDAHTFIHETGHMFGLNDYYDYDSKSSPAGQVDMMDHNVIDHNVYSKYLLNWTEPYYVTGDADITLRPAESSGDFILLQNDWNGHAYDEYILLEYYTPTGLNEKDATDGYKTGDSNLRGFKEAGVRMWHVDSRLVRVIYESETAEDYTYEWVDDIEPEDELSYTALATSNTSGASRRVIRERFKQLHLLDAKKRTGRTTSWLNSRTNADDKALYKEFHLIEANDWGVYFQNDAVKGVRPSTFNDKSEVGYTVQIGAMNEEGVAVKIRKAA